jgi:hypothetical protein
MFVKKQAMSLELTNHPMGMCGIPSILLSNAMVEAVKKIYTLN